MSTSTGVAPRRGRSPPSRRTSRSGDDLVARADAERHHRDEQRVGARRDADGVPDAEVRRELAFERLDLGAQDERWLSHTRVIAARISSRIGRVLRLRSSSGQPGLLGQRHVRKREAARRVGEDGAARLAVRA
jgi:hypothetical protein